MINFEATQKKLIIYHTNWATYDRNYQVKDIPFTHISDINYSFLDLKPNPQGYYVPTFSDPWADYEKKFTGADSVQPPDGGDIGPFGNLGQFVKLKQQGHRFSFGLSIGGWSYSKHFSVAARTRESRLAFVNECVAIVQQYRQLVDRIDLDWEHVSPPGMNYGDGGNATHADDGKNYGLLLLDLRSALNNSGLHHVTITACATGDPSRMSALPLDVMSNVLDSLNLMTYDYASSEWGPCISRHHSNLLTTNICPTSIDAAVQYLRNAGFPLNKIVIGAALYSRGFAATDGLGCPSNGVVPDKSWEAGVCDYKSLPRVGATEYYDYNAHGAYSYDPARKVLLTYDNVTSVEEKCKYVFGMGLKGIIVWESSADFPVDHPRSLLGALGRGLGGLLRQ